MTDSARFVYLSQEDLLNTGCLDLGMALAVVESTLLASRRGEVVSGPKVVRLLREETQERMHLLSATLTEPQVFGTKWISVFPSNPTNFGLPNVAALTVLADTRNGQPLAVLESTMCSCLRVGAVGATAARYLARPDAEVIGVIGAGEHAKMHVLCMKHAMPTLKTCRVAARSAASEQRFISQLSPLLPNMRFESADTKCETAMRGADILVTATSAQAPLLEADWVKRGAFYSHVGGWEDEFAVAHACDKIVCDRWARVKTRQQTLARMFRAGDLVDSDIHGDLDQVVGGEIPGRVHRDERIYFNAVGLSTIDAALAYAMYRRATKRGAGTRLSRQTASIFEHPEIAAFLGRRS